MDEESHPLEDEIHRLPVAPTYTWRYGGPEPVIRRSVRPTLEVIDLSTQHDVATSSEAVQVILDSPPASLVTRIIAKYSPPKRRGPAALKKDKPQLTTTEKAVRRACLARPRTDAEGAVRRKKRTVDV